MENDKDLLLLNELLSEVKKSEQIYHDAAASIHDSDNMKHRFQEIATQRKRFGAKVRDEIYRLGGVPHPHGSFRVFLRKIFLFVNSILVQRNNPYVLRACMHTEKEFSNKLIEILKKESEQSTDQSVSRLIGLYYHTIMNDTRRLRNEIDKFTWGREPR